MVKAMAQAPRTPRTTPSYAKLKPRSEKSSRVAKASSRKEGTICELMLVSALRRNLRLALRTAAADLPGCPDIVLDRARVVVFCDGDFWHGRNLEDRVARLARGHNADYWVRKIRSNVDRDRRRTAELEALGWKVLRFWETDIKRDALKVARAIAEAVGDRGVRRK